MPVTWRKTLVCLALAGLLLPGSILAKEKKDKKAAKEAAEESEAEWDVSNPPGDWRTLTIDTEETTWSNLDVSPDGRTIVFDMLGDLYQVPIEGGEATALTDGIEWNFQPRFSPDGERIAFISDRAGGDNLWVMDADGSDPVALTDEKEHLIHNPSWSPDGDWIVARKAFTSTRSIPAGEIWMYHRSGGDGLQLIERPNGKRDQKNIAEPAFSTDGRYVYFSQDTTPGLVWQYNKDATGQIFVIQRLDRVKGEVEEFVGGPGGAVRPTPSPDGTRLAFVRRLADFDSALFVKDLASGHERPVYTKFERDLQETSGSEGNTPAFAWTPDSRSLVFWSGGHFRRVDVDSREASIIPVHVKAAKKYHPALRFPVDVAPDRVPIKMPRWAQLSPDGSSVVFQALGHLYVRDAAGGEPRRLTGQTDDFEFYPSFSRDGRFIVYTTWNDESLGTVRVVSSAGGEGRVLTTQPGLYIEPAFSPDGKQVVFRRITGGFLLSGEWAVEPGIYRVATGGGEPHRILESGFEPHFGADPERVYYSDNVEATELVLRSVDLEGLDERTHFKGAKATSFRVSPDGRWVAFTEQFNVYVAPFARTGKTVDVGRKDQAIPVHQVSKRAGDFIHWAPDSKSLHWANGPTLYRRDLKDAFAFLQGAPEELPEPVEEGLDIGFSVPADVPEGTLALVGGRIVTMRDDAHRQEVIENGTVLVRGNRIEAVGPADRVTVPPGAFRLDVSGKTVIPGLIDVHEHGPMARDEITPQQNRIQYSNLAFGVTTIHDPSNDTSSIFSAAEMQRAGLIVAPRIFSTGTILYGAHYPGVTADIDSYEDALFHVRRMKEAGAISVKSYQQPRRDQRQQVIAAAEELGIMVVPEGGMKLQHNLNEIIDGHTGIEHSLTIIRGYDDLKQLWSQTDVGYTPTFVVAYGGISGENYWYQHTEVWKNERLLRYTPHSLVDPRAMRRPMAPEEHYNHIHVAEFAKELRDLGVEVHIGAHGQREGLGAHWELWMMEQGGFTPWEALRGGTIDGARYLGMDGDIGSIEKGKLADLVVIDGNPLEDLRRSEYVDYTVINGRLYEAATMNQIGNDQVARRPFYFEKEGGDTLHPETLAWMEEMERLYGCPHR